MVTVIIPALNEEDTISSVINFAKLCKLVTEIIVVDDKSSDHTVPIALDCGAKVITSTKLGKGASMKDGLLYSKNEIIVFLDADINPYPINTIEKLVKPIITKSYDFVKATFNRNAGRVTELVAKPLLNILFPDLSHYTQPLSGMIAGRKSFFEQIDFYDDYGVDIGLLIDMYVLKAKIVEINIGYIENKSKPWNELGKMSREVSKAIIAKALKHNIHNITLEEIQSFSQIRNQMEYALKEELTDLNKLVVFDMDNTILQGKFIDTIAKQFNFEDDLHHIRGLENDAIIITKNVAQLLKGISISEILNVLDTIPLISDIEQTIIELKKKGYIVGIISDSYDVVTNHIKTKIGADFSLGNELEFSKSVATGEVKIPSFFFNNAKSVCKHTICKTNAVQHILNHYVIDIKNTIAIGDGLNDLCMIKNAGIGVSFCSGHELLNYMADKVITKKSFAEVLDIIN